MSESSIMARIDGWSISKLRSLRGRITELIQSKLPEQTMTKRQRRINCFQRFLNGETIQSLAKEFHLTELTISGDIKCFARIILMSNDRHLCKRHNIESAYSLKLKHILSYKPIFLDNLNLLPQP